MAQVLRQRAVLQGIVERAAEVEAIDGIIALGSFAGGQPDALSDLDLIVVAADGQLDDAWAARDHVAGDPFVTWESRAKNPTSAVKWFKWLTHDMVKVECGIAPRGSQEVAQPFLVVSGPASLADAFPRIDQATVDERAARLEKEQAVFDPDEMTPGERIDWKLSEMKHAIRAALRSAAHTP